MRIAYQRCPKPVLPCPGEALVSISQEQRKKLGLPQQDGPESQLERTPSLERLEEGQELSPEIAEKLQPQMGNLAVQAILSRTASTSQTSTGSADHELAEEIGQQTEEEFAGGDLQLPDMQMGGGGGSGTPIESMPWELNFLFGGDEDPEDSPQRKTPKRRRRHSTPQHPIEESFDEPDESLPEHSAHIESTLGKTPKMNDEYRSGDARYRAIELGLSSPHAIGRRNLDPEAMVDRTDHLDPLGRATAIGRFIAPHGTHPLSRAVARITAGPASAVLPRQSGHAGAAARLATLTVCAEAYEGGGPHTDNAVRLALCHDAWSDALAAARHLASTGQVVAPLIVEHAGESLPEAPETEPRTHTQIHALPNVRFGQKALLSLLPADTVPIVPSVHKKSPPIPGNDPDLAAIDAVLQEMTGGISARDLPVEQRLEPEAVEPVLNAARTLVNKMGQTQVELAAAVIALARVSPTSSVLSILKHADRALRELARNVVRNGDKLHRSIGAPVVVLGDLPTQTVEQIRASSAAYQALRSWSLNAMAESLQQ